MLTLGGPGARLKLDIVGYQFASVKSVTNGWDSEWLQVSGDAECPRGRWKFTDPCLTTFELKRLASWLRRPVCGPDREIDFIEPNLRFEQVEEANGDVLYAHLSQEAAPPWATEVERYGNGYPLRIPFSWIDFAEAARAVEQMYRKYPVRANRGGA